MKRFLSLFLALLMIFSSSTLLFSCKDKKDDDEKDTSDDKGQAMEDDGSIFYERSLVDDELGEYDYEGRTLRVVAYEIKDFEVPEEERNQGNLTLDSRFERTERVKNRFNFDIEIVYTGTYKEIDDYVSKTVLSASDEFDLMEGMVMSMGGLVTKNLFLNWYDIEHIDFSKPWWYESNSTDLTYNNRSVIAISHLNYAAVSGAYAFYFNKDMAKAYDLGDIYDVVLDGDWTWDYFTSLIKDIYLDNGNDTRDAGDTYGMAQSTGTPINSYLWAFDNPVCAKDEEGVPQVSVDTGGKVDAIVNAVYDFCFNTNGVYCDPSAQTGGTAAYATDMFYEGKTIFMQSSLGTAAGEKLRNFESDYGIVPIPKWDENQPQYKTMVGGHHTALAVPKTVKDTEFVGRVVEALSAESWKTVTPTLYEVALKTRYLRDDESKEVMDIIIENTVFDFGTVYDNWNGFAFMLQFMMNDQNKNFRSYYAGRKGNAKAQIKKTVKAFDKL